MTLTGSPTENCDYGPPRISIELTNICNLHCRYCLRDDEALYGSAANYFPLDLLRRVLDEARAALGVKRISFTGGEPSLHPSFVEILELACAAEMQVSFVTNGWNFEKIWPGIINSRAAISHIAFSLDGITAEQHDSWRGKGSFVRVIRGLTRCHRAALPFVIKVGLRRDTAMQLESIAMFAARLGATALNFGHLLPTSSEVDEVSNLTLEERTLAEQEIGRLNNIFKMRVGIDVGYYNVDASAPCAPLAGKSCNVDYRGRLTLCCNLSGFRGAAESADIAADLNVEPFETAYDRLTRIAGVQMARRADILGQLQASHQKPDLFTGSPCLLCLQSFGKIPWRRLALGPGSGNQSLPLVNIIP